MIALMSRRGFTVLKTRIKMLKIGTMNLKIHTEEYGQIIKRKKYLVNSVTSPPYYAEQKLAQYRIGLSLKITCCKTAMPYSLFTCTSVNVPALHSRLANGMQLFCCAGEIFFTFYLNQKFNSINKLKQKSHFRLQLNT